MIGNYSSSLDEGFWLKYPVYNLTLIVKSFEAFWCFSSVLANYEAINYPCSKNIVPLLYGYIESE